MGLLSRFSRGALRLNRIEAFTDGVFAIIVTLLVLDLKVPDLAAHAGAGELGRRLLDLAPRFLSWLISFIILSKFWLNHHYVLSMASHANYGFVWLNSIFLMFQSFVPFPTALMGQYPRNPLAVSFFGGVLAMNTVLFILLHAYVRRYLLKPELAGTENPKIVLKEMLGPASYLAGAASAWLSVEVAFAIYLLTPLLFITPPPPPTPRAAASLSDPA